MKHLVVALLIASGCHYDENLGFSAVGEPRWAISVGGRDQDRGMLAAFDSLGDVVACGDYFGPADFGSGLEDVGGPWPFITKRVASDGAERWTKRLSGLAAQSHVDISAMAIAPGDDIVVTGYYFGTVDFGGQVLALSEPDPPDHGDMFLARYASDGQLRWVHGLGDASNAAGIALAIDASGGIYVTGGFGGALVFDGTAYPATGGDPDLFLIAYDGGGTRRWFHLFPVTGVSPRSMAIAANGDVLVGGSFTSPASFGGAVINPDARVRGFMTRFRSDGLYVASSAVGPTGTYASWGPEIRVATDGRIVLQQLEVDESDGVSTTTQGSTLRVLDPNGVELWTTALANHGRFSPQERALLTTPDGLIATAAWTDNPKTTIGNMEVLTFDAGGASTESSFGSRLAISSDPGTFVFAAAVSATGALAFTGQFGGMVDLGSGPMATRGQSDTDAFVVVVDPPLATQ